MDTKVQKCDVDEVPIIKLDDLFRSFHLVADKTIAYGHFSRVVLANSQRDTNKTWAVKMYEVDQDVAGDKEKLRKVFENEVRIMNQLNHPFISSKCVATECPGYFSICRHFYQGGSLLDRLRLITEEDAERYFDHVTCAVVYLHKKRIAHGDIKLANILLNASDQAVLADFDLAMEVPAAVSKVSKFGGTLGYLAPEVLTDASADPFKVDVYAVGVVLWGMLFRRRPREHICYLDQVNKKVLIPYRLRIALHMLLHPDPNSRTAMNSLVDKMKGGTLLKEFEDRLETDMESSGDFDSEYT